MNVGNRCAHLLQKAAAHRSIRSPGSARPFSLTAVVEPETPVAATVFLHYERPPGPLFKNLLFDSYLIWAAQPDYPFSADRRLDLYPFSHWLEYLSISADQPGWEKKLAQHEANTLMLTINEQIGLISQARASQHWCLTYEDVTAIIFTRSEHQGYCHG